MPFLNNPIYIGLIYYGYDIHYWKLYMSCTLRGNCSFVFGLWYGHSKKIRIKLWFFFFKICLIVYFSQILSDFQNSSLYKKLIKNPTDWKYEHIATKLAPDVPPSLKIIVYIWIRSYSILLQTSNILSKCRVSQHLINTL